MKMLRYDRPMDCNIYTDHFLDYRIRQGNIRLKTFTDVMIPHK